MWDPYAEFESATLPNGLKVHAAHWPGRPWEAMGFLIHSGAEHDPVGLEGLSHFVEHMVSENAHIPKKEIEAFFEDCGGSVTLGTTGYPYTRYQFFVPSEKAILAKAFSVFGPMLLSAKIGNRVERERHVIIGEFNRHYPFKFNLDLDIREHKALYTDDWLGRFVRPLGNLESIGRITQGDLQSHYDRHYTPANMSVVAVGGMPLAELVALLSESPFATSKEGTRTPLPIPVALIAPPTETRYVFEVSEHFKLPAEVGSYRSVAKLPGTINGRVVRIAQEMLNEVLNEEVRERRAWAYSIGSSRCDLRHFYEFVISCDAFALKAIDDIEEVIETCVGSLGNREELFEQTKRRALIGNFMSDPTGRGVCNEALHDLADHQRIISLTEVGDDLERVTMADVRNVCEWLRREQRWTRIACP